MPATWGAALLELDTARLLGMPADPAGLGADEALPESLRRFMAEVGSLVLRREPSVARFHARHRRRPVTAAAAASLTGRAIGGELTRGMKQKKVHEVTQMASVVAVSRRRASSS